MKYLAAFALAIVATMILADVSKAGDCRHAQPVVVQQVVQEYVPVQAQAVYTPQFAVQTYAAPVAVQQVVVQRQFVQQRQFATYGGFQAQAQIGGRQRAIGGGIGGGGDVIRRLLPVAGAVGGAIVGGPVGAGVGAILGGVLAR